MKLGPVSLYKISSKWIKGLNLRIKTIKLLEENTEVELWDPEIINTFLESAPKGQVTKENIDKLVFIKIFKCRASDDIVSEDNIKKVKRQCIEWEKVFANHLQII